MDHDSYPDDYIVGILNDVRTIAVVGMSADPARPSHYVAVFLKSQGYRVIPVNPGLAGEKMIGKTVYASLRDIPEPVDMVDCFRVAEDIPPIVEDAIAINAKVVWMQLGIRNDAAAQKAEAAGIKVVMDRCPKIEFGHLGHRITVRSQ